MAAPSTNRPSAKELHRLYVHERLTTQAIAAKCDVRRITVRRWLQAAGIKRRPVGRGLANRGLEAPSADLLRRLVHEEHMSYREIARRYDVDFTAIPHWLKRHGIERPTIWSTRRKGIEVTEPTADDLRTRVAAGQSLRSVALDFMTSEFLLRKQCKGLGIALTPSGMFGRHAICSDGHPARSGYELLVDNWLYEHDIPHEVEPSYPFNRRYRADFLAHGTYIEVWGVANNQAYELRRQWKVDQCKHHGLPLIEIDSMQFTEGGQWWLELESLRQPSGSASFWNSA